MAKRREQSLVPQTFTFTSEAELNTLIAAHRVEHQKLHGQTLAMDSRRPLGPGKVMITFRIVEKPGR
jgi:hypothetical protein